ncbi:hypothetical protein SOCE26_079330 [Sorangium cellulosum]|uniref:YcaO domain-containing protein n=1 Tax=Sorangium cellulosum TaxID=56 RepID=A0A2L0F4G9_SORCE|nr:TOMM precursor leader peptide-binding protein [Sorangium cellulosum]AUX46427.1 hypothetical protein SOCE26_079330 [Sorangium cellulosum]
MNRVLCFKRHLRPERAGDDLVLLLGEREQFLLKGRAYALLAPLLDGRRTVLELIAALADKVSAAEVAYALSRLEERGYLVEAAPGEPPEAAAFWEAAGVAGPGAARRLGDAAVAVQAVGGEDPGPLCAALAEAGLALRDDAPLCALVVGDYLDPALEGWNREARARGVRWLPVKPSGAVAWAGPLFRPDRGPCWACLAERLRHNRPVERFVLRRTGARGPLTPPRAATPASLGAAARLAALALARAITSGDRGPLDDQLLTLDLAQHHTEAHAVVRRPQCPECGDPGLTRRRMLEPVALAPRPKRFTEDGGHRTLTPAETLARLAPQISRLTGVISSSGPLGGADHPLCPVYGASYAACPATDAPSPDVFERRGNGKGRTAAQAHASALCEAIERYSAVFQGDEPRRSARLADLGGEAVHPAALLGISERQHHARDVWNTRIADPSHHLPQPFDEQAEIDWTPAWSLTHDERRYLPTAYCYIDPPRASDRRFFSFNTNGHAAGNCLEEAVLQGFLELVERDAFALWWYNRAPRPGVDLAGFDEPYLVQLEAHYRSLGLRAWVLDLTTDLEIPAFAAIARSAQGDLWSVGFGCHLEARLGVQRALTELNQLLALEGRVPPPWDTSALGDAAFLLPDGAAPARTSRDYPGAARDDLRDDVLSCVERAARAGLETIVLDQTRPDTGLCAVKVVVPGLRHFRPQLAPGRLYDVPVRLGWLERPRTEEEMNPALLYM